MRSPSYFEFVNTLFPDSPISKSQKKNIFFALTKHILHRLTKNQTR